MPLAVLVLATLAAQAAPTESAAERLTVDEEALHDALMAEVNRHLFPERLGLPPDADGPPHGVTCLTPLVAKLKDHWEIFSTAERAEITGQLAPWKRDLLDPMSPPSANGAPPAAGTPCLGDYASQKYGSEHFSVQWEGSTATATAQAFSDALETSWDVEIDQMGWKRPVGMPNYPMLVIIYEQASWAGAYTTVDYCSGVGYAPYIVAGSGSFASGDWYKDMAAHEFNHASQFAYGFAHEFWWWEATALYNEENVYPSNNYWSDYLYTYSQYPYIGMNASDQSDSTLFWHTYAMGIFGFHLDNHYGGYDTVISTWERSQIRSGTYDYWMPDAIGDIGLDFDEVYSSFLAYNTVMDYDEQRSYYAVDLEDSFNTLPETGEPSRYSRPESLGANYFKFSKDAFDGGDTLQVTFSGDDSVDWYVVMVNASASEVDSWDVVDVTGGEGVGTMEWKAGKDMYVVVSPSDENAQGGDYNWTNADNFDYSFEAEAIPAGAGDGGADGGGGDGGGDEPVRPTPEEGDGLFSCGSAPAPTGGLGLAWAVGLLALARRRKD